MTIKRKILIVDDTLANLKVLGECLRDLYEVVVATKGETALQMARADIPPDLILLDIIMPGMNGYEVCTKLKQEPDTAAIPIIFVTALSESGEEAKGLEMGAVDYITKPFSPSIVRARVKNHLDLKRAREELEKQNEVLKENARLLEEMERISRHDLKTPLNTIINLPQLMLEGDDLSQEYCEYLRMIENSGYRMLSMINLSLDLFKMEKKIYPLRPVAVPILAVLRKVVQDLNHLAVSNDNAIVTPGDDDGETDKTLVWGDELLCYSMLGNLLKNAIEASPSGAAITISMTIEAEICLRIHNRGVVPEEIRDRFFEKYTTAGKMSGTGLGTYSARLIVETMGGSLTLDTSQAENTALEIRFKPAMANLPKAPSMTLSVKLDPKQRNSLAKEIAEGPDLHILLVDDDQDSRKVLEKYLNYPKLHITIAGGGREGLARFQERPFDMVFLDLDMPMMDGMETASAFRNHEREAGRALMAKIIALSAFDDIATRERCLKGGFDAYLVKPVNRDAVAAVILGRPVTPVAKAEPPQPTPVYRVAIDSDLETLMPTFLERKNKEIKEMFTAFNSGNSERVREFAHRLSGGFNMYGMTYPGRLCRRIQDAVLQDDPARIPPLLEELETFMERLEISYQEAE